MTDGYSPLAEVGTPGRFQLTPFADIAVSRDRAYLVKGLVPNNGLTVMWGPPKCGKSFWVFDLSMHIALGWPYRGRRVSPGSVVYIACEGAAGFRARVEAFRLEHLAKFTDPIPFYLMGERIDLVVDHGAMIGRIRAQIDESPPTVVVIDTLNRSMTGSESRDEDMAAYVAAADAIRAAFSCAVIIVHHCGVKGSRPRGHTSLTGAADAQIAVKRDASGVIVAEVEWMKDGAEGDKVASRLEIVEVGKDVDGDVITSCVVVEADEKIVTLRTKIPKSARTALELLSNAIIEAGEIPPASNHVPVGIKAVHINLWRSHCNAGTVTDSDDPDSKRKAFNRARKNLLSINEIGVWREWVWIPENTSGTCGT